MARTVKPTAIPESNIISDPLSLGMFIRAKRTADGLNIHDAAALCNVSVDTLGNLEKGTGTVSLEKAFHIMRMLGVELRIEPWDESV